MFQFVFSCCLLASFLFLTTGNVGMIRHILKRQADTCASGLVARQHAASFTSPGFPLNYPDNADCSWRIRTSPGNQIIVSFVSFDVEWERHCQYDYLIIYDGPDDTHPQVGRYCGQTTPAEFTSTSPQVFVKFRSDTSDVRGGFEIQFGAIGDFGGDGGEDSQGGDLGGKSGGAGAGAGAGGGGGDGDGDGGAGRGEGGGGEGGAGGGGGGGLDHGDEDGEVGEPDLLLNGVFSGDGDALVGSGDNSGGEVLVQGSNNRNTNSSGDNAENADSAQQTIEVNGCNQVWHNARHGDITSPGYPSPYPSNADCTIEINALPNHRIDLTFHSFDLEEYYCVFDYVLVKDSIARDADPLVRLCGTELPDDVQSTTGVLVISFVSDAADVKGGFRASFVTRDVTVSTAGYEALTTAPEVEELLEFINKPVDETNLQLGDLVGKKCSVDLEGATVKWFRENTELPAGESMEGVDIEDLPRGSLLIISSIEAEHVGIYSCQAQLPGHPTIMAPFVLRIGEELSSPDYISSEVSEGFVDFETTPEDASITDGTDHVLLCSSSEGLRIVWEKDGTRVVYNERIYPLFADNLLVGDARVTDSGTYSCIAYNEDGIQLGSVSAQLTVKSSLDMSDVCGLVTSREAADSTKPKDKQRIVNGEVALKGSSPWIARLWHLHEAQHFCGGSLINYRWVVTAAHCIKGRNTFGQAYHNRAEQIEVRLGDHDSMTVEDSEMKFRISRIVLPEDYQSNSFNNDIALLELDPRVSEFTEYVSPICLPKRRLSERLLVPDEYARIAGWGKITENGIFPRYLRELYVPIVPEITCRESAGSRLTGNMFCAGYRQAAQGDACQGDSGGPLAMKKGNKWHLLGVISWGQGCSRADKYGFYSKVVNYVTWMRDVMTEGT